jgi:heme-degrading monooxygenase HmoA
MSEPAVLIATAKVRSGKEDAFATWKAHHDTIIAKFPGFISSDIMPPDEHSDAWTIVLNFKSGDLLTDWQQSKERGALIAELLPLLRGGDIGEAMQKETSQAAQPGTNVTQVILSKIRPGMEDAYRAWIISNPHGFVLSTYRDRPSYYMSLHRATCSSISVVNSKMRENPFTGQEYVKICSIQLEEIRQWMLQNGLTEFSRICKRCSPYPGPREVG